MMCRNPYMAGTLPFGCGQCLPCRINKRRIWTLRMMLEEMVTVGDSSYVTLTYEQNNLPSNAQLNQRDVTLYLKRLRKKVGQYRYYAVGEYGMEKLRPHYHLIVFGVSEKICVGCRHNGRRKKEWPNKCDCEFHKHWNKGYAEVDVVNKNTIQYVAGYVLKKLSSRDSRLEGREPQFAVMSRNKGLGIGAVKQIADMYKGKWQEEMLEDGDIQHQIMIGGTKWPLGRYLIQKIREELGLDEKEVSDKNLTRYREETDESTGGATSAQKIKRKVVEMDNQKSLNQEARSKIYDRRNKL